MPLTLAFAPGDSAKVINSDSQKYGKVGRVINVFVLPKSEDEYNIGYSVVFDNDIGYSHSFNEIDLVPYEQLPEPACSSAGNCPCKDCDTCPEDEEVFRVGDLVQLMGGDGPLMTINGFSEHTNVDEEWCDVECVYWDIEQHKFKFVSLDLNALTMVEAQDD